MYMCGGICLALSLSSFESYDERFILHLLAIFRRGINPVERILSAWYIPGNFSLGGRIQFYEFPSR